MMNMQDLKSMIDGQVSEMNLDGILDDSALEQIRLKVMSAYNHEKAINEIPEIIPEAVVANVEEDPIKQPMNQMEPESIETSGTNFDGSQTPGQNIDQGTTGNIPAFTPELPSFLDKVEPGKVIVFSQNELSEGGENLSNKPIRTFSDPDVKKSMHDIWIEKGQKKAEVYLAKLEKIGELNYDFANGATTFTEKRFEPDFEAQAKYKENPYAVQNAMSGVITNTDDSQIIRQIATSVDLQKVVEDVVKKMLMQQVMTDTTSNQNKSFNPGLGTTIPNPNNLPTTPEGVPIHPTGLYMQESLDLNMRTIVDEFQKIDTPKKLKEALDTNDKTLLIRENEEVQEWRIEGELYYTPVNKISTRKCYIK